MGKRPVTALLLTLVMVAAACGSRTDEEPGDQGLGETSTTEAGTGAAAGPAMAGTLESPCGPGEASGATDVGVTDDEIAIATIADVSGPVPGLLQHMHDAMAAFVGWCNSLGGVEGRELRLQTLDSALFEHRAATLEACANAFALVGSGAVFDSAGAQDAVDCGIPDVAGFTLEPEHAAAENMVQPLPNPPNLYNVGPPRYLAEQYPEAVARAGMLYVNLPSTDRQHRRQIEAYEAVGFDFVYESGININEPGYGPQVLQLRGNDVGYVTIIADDDDLAQLQTDLHQQDYQAEVVEGAQQNYNQDFLAAGGANVDGTLVIATTWPFEEADQNPGLQLYLEWLEREAPDAVPDALGVQGWSAGLLFATAARELGSDLTRAGLLEELQSIHDWDGGGIHGVSDPGANVPSGCFAYLMVEDGAFTRHFPDEGFECSDDNILELQGDYGAGATSTP